MSFLISCVCLSMPFKMLSLEWKDVVHDYEVFIRLLYFLFSALESVERQIMLIKVRGRDILVRRVQSIRGGGSELTP